MRVGPCLLVLAALVGCKDASDENAPRCLHVLDVCLDGDCEPDDRAPDALSVRRLSKVEYVNSIRDAFGIDEPEAPLFPEDDPARPVAAPATALDVIAYNDAAHDVGFAAGAAVIEACGDNGRPCVQEAVEGWGRRLFRRSLSTADLTELDAICGAEREVSGVSGGLGRAAELLLQSPEFLYVSEHGRADAAASDLRPLTDRELAVRLALALWRGPPDDALLEAASAGTLATPDGLVGEVARMLDDPRAATMAAAHVSAWLAPELVAPVAAGDQTGVGSSSRHDAVLEQLRLFVAELFAGDGGLEAFLLVPDSPVNGELASVYGMELEPEAAFAWEATGDRRGLLSLPAFLAAKATPSGTSIVGRGKFVLERMLCRAVPPPPPGVETMIPEPRDGETERERFARHATDPACAACHASIDPLGFAFEHYDKRGKYRTKQKQERIDASGTVTVDGERRSFDNAVELAELLAGSAEVGQCWTSDWVRRMLPTAPPETLEALIDQTAAATDNKTSLRALLTAIVTSDRFGQVAPSE